MKLLRPVLLTPKQAFDIWERGGLQASAMYRLWDAFGGQDSKYYKEWAKGQHHRYQ